MEMESSLHGAVGGALIGLASVWLMGALGRIAGISGIVSGLMFEKGAERPWRLAFLLGLVSGPLLLVALGGDLGNVAGAPGEVIGAPAGGVGLMLVAGLLIGLGTGLGSGCTSGHGVCGLARLSPRSLAATGVFVAVAMITVFIMEHLLEGIL